MRRTLAMTAACLALCGPAAAAAEPAGDWVLGWDGDAAVLDYKYADAAKPDALSISCAAREVGFDLTGAPPAAVASGGKTLSVTAQDAVAGADDPVLKAFRQTGTLTLTQGGVRRELAASAPGRAAIAEFFEFCDPVR